MKVYFASDHRGDGLRKAIIPYIQALGYDVEDLGMDPHFPIAAKKESDRIIKDKYESRGILICGTGEGMAMAANRYGVRAGLGYSTDVARQCREHLDANILTIGADEIGKGMDISDREKLVKEMVKIFLETEYLGTKDPVKFERYNLRIAMFGNPPK